MTLPELRAEPAAIAAYAAALRDAAARLAAAADPGLRIAPEAWEGLAADRYAAVSEAIGRTSVTRAAALRAVADRVDQHAEEVGRLLTRRAELAATGRDGDHAEVRAWQAAVAAEERDVARALAGRCAPSRHAANRAALGHDLARLGRLAALGALTRADQQRWLTALATHRALDRIAAGTDPVTGWPVPATLWLYEPGAFGGDGRVAVVAGDLDAADDVAVIVPGLGTDAASAPFQADRALTLHLAARHHDPRAANATMAWLGYDAPDNLPVVGDGDVLGVVDDRLAVAGGDLLSADVDDLRASLRDRAHVTVVGYSYGSTVSGLAAAGPGLAADDLVMVGSPGAGPGVDRADDSRLDPGRVWVLRNSHDPVVALGGHGWVPGGTGLGDDPAEDDWSGARLQAESVDRGSAGAWGDHTSYFEPHTESLHSLAAVVSGEHGDALTAPGVHDPWWAPPRDPEEDRHPTAPSTGPVR